MNDKKQIINCTVESCKYNNTDTQMCELKQIVVSPLPNCDQVMNIIKTIKIKLTNKLTLF